MSHGPQDIQHIDDIEIPDIEITRGWIAADCKSLDDCDDAFAYLTAAIAQIEFQIEVEEMKLEPQRDLMWLARARCALRYKKGALNIVNTRRSRLIAQAKKEAQQEKDRVLLRHIRTSVPEAQYREWVRASGCEEFDLDAAA